MANEPISALTLFTSYSTADEVEILDVSDTTFASTGTNKRIPFSTLLTMAGVGTAAGVATVAGGGTGLTAVGSADQLLGVAHTGGALEYKTLTAGSNVTITPAAGSITISAAGGSSGGLMIGNAISGGTASAVLYENSSSNLAASANLEFDGTNLGLNGTTPTISTTSTSITLKQTGDSGGASSLTLENRPNANGALFKNSSYQLVDFAFQDSAGNQNNIRSASGSTFTHGYGNTSGEFDFIVNILGSGVAVLYMGGSTSQFYGAGTGRISNNVAFGTQPAGALHVVSAATNAPGLVVDGLASQSSDLAEFRNSTPTVLSRVTAAGEINGPIAPIYTALTGTATATTQQCLIAVSAASAGWTLILPAANAVQAGHEYLIKKTDNNSNAITVTAAGSDTIDGATTYILSAQWAYVRINSNGGSPGNWMITGSGTN
jgi:hypothetical protein